MSEQTSTPRTGPDIFIPSTSIDDRKISLAPVSERPFGYVPPNAVGDDSPPEERAFRSARALEQFEASLPPSNGELGSLRPFFVALAANRAMAVNGVDFDPQKARVELAKAAEPANAIADEWRKHARWYQTTGPNEGRGPFDTRDLMREVAKSDNPLAKAVLDVNTSQNFASITGGQALGYVSLDTRVARATVRPDSFTLYQSLAKSAAYQVVDYWPYIDDPGGALPGSATSGFSNVSSSTLATNAGIYSLQSVNLKLMLDGRAVTLALMAQNNFVSINEQENANAALTVLQTANWLCYHGNSTTYANQFNGLDSSVPTANIFDFQAFYSANAALQGWNTSQTLYNMIYEVAAAVTSWGRFGRITHAFMTPTTAGALQSLVTTTLNNLVNARESIVAPGIVVDGDLQGMRTRMGPIQFPMDLTITARDMPAQGQTRSNSTTPATTSAPTPAVSVTASYIAASGVGTNNWNAGSGSAFIVAATRYYYAVAATDVNMNESTLVYSGVVAGSSVSTTGAVNLAIIGPANGDCTGFRVFRTGAAATSAISGVPTAYRYIGNVAANATNASGLATFYDLNTTIPGADRIYLLDLRAEDNALDYRYLLPLTRVELFAQNLYMPWAVAAIGALRNRIPRFHAIITNFVPDSATWNPLGASS